MRKLFLIIALAFSAPVLVTSCSLAPSARVAQVQTLKAVGNSADAAVALSAQLFRDNRITAVQAREVITFYNTKFQPAFRLAVSMVNANLDSLASPDLISLASQLASLVIQFQNHTP